MTRFLFVGLALLALTAQAQTDTTLVPADTLRTPNTAAVNSQVYQADSVLTAAGGVLYPMSVTSTQFAVTGNYSSINGLDKYALLTSAGAVYNFGEPYKVPVVASFIFSKVNEVLQQREINVATMPTFKPANGKVRYYADAAFEQSYVRSILARYSAGLGAGYLLHGRNKQGDDKSELLLSTFLLYEDTNVRVKGAESAFRIVAYRVSTRLKWRFLFLENNRVALTGFVLFAPRFNAPDVYKLAGNTALNYKLWHGLSMVLSYDYLSEQLLMNGSRKTSTVASAGFAFKL